MFFIHGKKFKAIKYFKLGDFVMFRCVPYQILGHTTTSEGIKLVQLCECERTSFIYLPFDFQVYNAELHQDSFFDSDDLPF